MLKNITDWLPEFETLSYHGPVTTEVKGNANGLERSQLGALVEWTHARTVFEFGTFNGATAFALALVPGVEKIWTLDLPDGVDPLWEIESDDANYLHTPVVPLPGLDRVEFLRGDSATFDFSPYWGQCDVVFVMGAHSLVYIRSDLENAFKMVREHGLVIWHAGTPDPVAAIGQEYDVYLSGSRMGLVEQLAGKES